MKKRVVITGLGTVNPLGKTTEETWAKIKNNECGLSFISGFDTTDYQVKVAGEVADFDPTPVIDKRAAKRMDRFCQFAVVSAHEAVKMSGVDLDTIDKDRFGVIIGSGIGGIGSIEEQEQRLLEKSPSVCSNHTDDHHQHGGRLRLHRVWSKGPGVKRGDCLCIGDQFHR